MLSRVEVRTRRGTLLTLPLEDPENGYAIEEIQGLDPVKATLVSSGSAQMDGENFHHARRESRNIKLKIAFESDYSSNTVESLRQKLYSYLMPKAQVDLRFHMTSGLYVDITGWVESNEAPLFTQEPEADVSLMCFKPDFIDPIPVPVSGMSTSGVTEKLIPYIGTVETGILFTFNVNRPLTSFTIYHRPPDDTIRQLSYIGNLLAGDKVVISTVPGNKYAYLTRDNVVSSVLYAVSPQANWLSFSQGSNYIRVYASGEPSIPYTIDYTTRYGGL